MRLYAWSLVLLVTSTIWILLALGAGLSMACAFPLAVPPLLIASMASIAAATGWTLAFSAPARARCCSVVAIHAVPICLVVATALSARVQGLC